MASLARRSLGECGWRPIIGSVVKKFLECGDLKHGFARVRCPKCREEFLVPYSCRGRCFCPSCLPGRSFSEGRPSEAGVDPGSHLVRYYGWRSNKTRG